MTVPEPQTQEFNLLGRDDVPLKFKGRLLGFATSKRDIHTHDDVFTTDEAIDTEITVWEDRLLSLPRRFTADVAQKLTGSVEKYLHELADDDFPRRYAAPGDRCSACRWFEVQIFEVDAQADDNGTWISADNYLLLTHGASDVPGETSKRRTIWTNSPFRIVEELTQRRGTQAFLPSTSAKVLSEAAAMDPDIADAYVNRAVA